MCGRFTLRAPASVIAEQFGPFEMPPFAARFNIAPTQPVAVVRRAAAGSGRELAWLRWGLVPAWAKDPAIGARRSMRGRRPRRKSPHFGRRCARGGAWSWPTAFTNGGGPAARSRRTCSSLTVAGRSRSPDCGRTWRRPDNSPLETCTLLTTDANELVRPIHDRMPAILPPAAYQAWLDAAVENPSKLAPYPERRDARPGRRRFRQQPSPRLAALHRGGVAASGTGIKFGCSARVWSSEGEG